MSTRFALRPQEHLDDPSSKEDLNHALFSEVAPRYDFITRALSLGRDASWKRRLIAELPDLPAPLCVDIACGTGDLTRLLAARFPEGRVTGIDLTPAMLDIARGRTQQQNIEYTQGTMHALPLEDACADVLTGGYALRNAPDLDRALDEIRRVLRPGGFAAFLDFSKPPSSAGQLLSHVTLKAWGGFWGLALHGNPDVYGYIADSLRLYPDRDELRMHFREREFVLHTSLRFFGGLLEASVVEKAAAAGAADRAHTSTGPT